MMAINLRQFVPELVDACMKSLDNGAGILVSAAKSKAPVRTGQLQTSIEKKDVDITTKTVGAKPKQAKFQELGTVHHKPQPFMRPAFDNNAIKIVDAAEKAVVKKIKEINSSLKKK